MLTKKRERPAVLEFRALSWCISFSAPQLLSNWSSNHAKFKLRYWHETNLPHLQFHESQACVPRYDWQLIPANYGKQRTFIYENDKFKDSKMLWLQPETFHAFSASCQPTDHSTNSATLLLKFAHWLRSCVFRLFICISSYSYFTLTITHWTCFLVSMFRV